MHSSSALAVLLVLTGVVASGSDLDSGRASQEVAELKAVVRRDSTGAVEQFSDSLGRKHTVAYDAAKQVTAIRKRPDRVYLDDLLNIAYAEDGRLASVLFGNGNAWFFSYDANGTQFVQDRFGRELTRRTGLDGRPAVPGNQVESAEMAADLEKLYRLLSALKPQTPK